MNADTAKQAIADIEKAVIDGEIILDARTQLKLIDILSLHAATIVDVAQSKTSLCYAHDLLMTRGSLKRVITNINEELRRTVTTSEKLRHMTKNGRNVASMLIGEA